MGGLSQRTQGPRTPKIVPTIIIDDENDPVPLYFLDNDLKGTGSGIDDHPSSPIVSTRSLRIGTMFSTLPALRKMQTLTSAKSKQRKHQKHQEIQEKKASSQSPSKLGKLVRFLDIVEIVPALVFCCSSSPPNMLRAPSPPASRHKKQKLYSGLTTPPSSPTTSPKHDSFVTAGLGRAGSPNDFTDCILSPPPSPGPICPHSWRIPPSTLTGHQPHVHKPPRVLSPSCADEEVDLGIRQMRSCSELPSPQSPYQAHPVIARKMWPTGELRFQDQWGHRLIPVVDEGRGPRKDSFSFRFDLWPVEEEGVGTLMGNKDVGSS